MRPPSWYNSTTPAPPRMHSRINSGTRVRIIRCRRVIFMLVRSPWSVVRGPWSPENIHWLLTTDHGPRTTDYCVKGHTAFACDTACSDRCPGWQMLLQWWLRCPGYDGYARLPVVPRSPGRL